jgi:hypothetical protein
MEQGGNGSKYRAEVVSELCEGVDVVPKPEVVRYADGHGALLYKKPGDSIDWRRNKYGQNLRFLRPNLAIVSMRSGRRYALGQGVVVELPQLNSDTGRLEAADKEPWRRTIDELAPHGLPEATIGEPWPVIDCQDAVTEILFNCNNLRQPDEPSQPAMPNPFDYRSRSY